MKQFSMFEIDQKEGKYTNKISAPIYTPRGIRTNSLELIDIRKSSRLIKEIRESNISDNDKKFLLRSACRHDVFNYELIADYYANSDKDVQHLMEKSALVIIDFEKAIESGFILLSDEIRSKYLEDYNGLFLCFYYISWQTK